MNKAELLKWLKDEHNAWKSLISQFTSSNWDKPGVAGYWSMKDVLAHLVDWNHHMVAVMQAVQSGEIKPAPPWVPNDHNRLFCRTHRTFNRSKLRSSNTKFKSLII